MLGRMGFRSLRLLFFLNTLIMFICLFIIHKATIPSQQSACNEEILSLLKTIIRRYPGSGVIDKPTKHLFHPIPAHRQNVVGLPAPFNVTTVLNRLKKAVTNAWNYNASENDQQLLSRRMNLMLMELNQFMCELYDKETTTGGWCVYDFKTGHITDVPLATALSHMLENFTVASFGDGPGQYRRIILEHGLVKSYDAFDGCPMIAQLTDGNVTFLDLTIPQYGLPLYDWVMSLEVIEHIPSQFEDIAVENLVRHAKTGLILSWPQPGQGGLGHVNERLDAYVLEKLRSHCFERDLDWSFYLREQAKLQWLKSNIYVYLRGKNCTADPSLA